jgi:adenine-specific DNA-methyltransferase
VQRVMQGYGKTPGKGGGFDFYELGEQLFSEDGALNDQADLQKLRQYVFYSEAKSGLPTHDQQDNGCFLGEYNDTAYYFHYEKGKTTTLDHAFLSSIGKRAGQYVIYADNCLLTKEFLSRHNIFFKKIPRDLTRF